ncbi:MAG: ribonuclease HII [Candidatus Paceibacteria bacterium]|jgi:ribonuclease HII
MKWIVGVDEAGRGPLAGPVTVGLVKIPADFDWELVPGVRDSKKISEKKREVIYKRVIELYVAKKLSYVVKSVSAKSIDSKGIAPAIRRSIAAGIEDLECDPKDTFIKLDGSLHAPVQFEQETIIKGDDKEMVIGLASIMAKVTRDHYMIEQDSKYPVYGLAQHKGYGTKAHMAAIAEHGFSPIHRQTYCKNVKML